MNITYYWKPVREIFKGKLNICIILAAGIIARILFFYSIDGAITTSDSPTYIDGAMSLYYHLWLNEYRPPVYPFGLMLVGILFNWSKLNNNIIILQVLLSLINIVFIYKLVLEAFSSKATANIAAFIAAVSYRVFSWDFVILTENFAILLVTMVSYYTITYLKYKRKRDFKLLTAALIAGIFTKPFFLMLPIAIFSLFILRGLLPKAFQLRAMAKKAALGLAVIYLCVFAYSFLNYIENVYFGITTVGNVNYFGKILQYNMEDLGKNEALKKDLKRAFETEQPEFKVNGKYLEPWHFVGTYGWAKGHYREVGKFSKEIIMNHPIRYLRESIKLTYELFVLNSPFKDYIAEAEIKKAGHPHPAFTVLGSITDAIDLLYILLVLCFMETVFLTVFNKNPENTDRIFFTSALMVIILYHYVISAFFSYGDYCRLLAPCYPLIYIIISTYIYRFIYFIYCNIALAKKEA